METLGQRALEVKKEALVRLDHLAVKGMRESQGQQGVLENLGVPENQEEW